jgi:hypothetical protein
MENKEINMKYKELAKKIEGKHILPMNKNNLLTTRGDLYALLKLWKKITKAETIGDLEKYNKNHKIIILKTPNNYYVIDADTTREGVSNFLENRKNDWSIIDSLRGNRNKVTNNIDQKPIKGFYMYKVK